MSFKSAAIPHWSGSRQLTGKGEASSAVWKATKGQAHQGAGGLPGVGALLSQGKLVIEVAVDFQRCHLCEGVDWTSVDFHCVFVNIVVWLNSSLIRVKWEELTAQCVSHLLSAFIGRNSH